MDSKLLTHSKFVQIQQNTIFCLFQAMVINIRHQKVNASFTHKQRNLFHMLSVSLGVL